VALDLSQFLTEVKVHQPRLAVALQNIQDAINQSAILAGTDSTQHTAPPDPPQSLQVAAGDSHVHVTLTDHSQRSKALNYFVEYSVNDPNFRQPHVEHLGASRGRVLALPANDGDNAPISYYFRGYSSYLGSRTASPKVYHGNNLVPTPVTLTGTSKLTLLPSQGSGTNSTTGQQSGTGFGQAQFAKAKSA
jgi:hypothetical protein